jgi:hypothetical protein
MKQISKKFTVLLLFSFLLTEAQGQQVVSVTGGDTTENEGSVSYSIGQIAYMSQSESDGSVIQGIQQPYEILVVTGMGEKSVTMDYSVYPNPAAGVLQLKIENKREKELRYQLYNMNGKLVQSKKITNSKISISLRDLPSAVYFLRVMERKDEITLLKTFKIIKK